MNREALAAAIMDALDSLWVTNDRVLGKLHARDEILAALSPTEGGEVEWEYAHVMWGEVFPVEDEQTARIAASLRPVGTVVRRRTGTWEQVSA